LIGEGIDIFVAGEAEEEDEEGEEEEARLAPLKYVLSFFEALSIEESCSHSSPNVDEDHLDLRPYLLSSSSPPSPSPSSANSSIGSSDSRDKIGEGGKESDEIDVIVEHR